MWLFINAGIEVNPRTEITHLWNCGTPNKPVLSVLGSKLVRNWTILPPRAYPWHFSREVQVTPSLAKPPLKFSGSLAKTGLTTLVQ